LGTKEVQEAIVANMKSWQKVENSSVVSTGRIMEKTDNPIVRLIMEIIQRDSQMHYRVQQLIADSLESATTTLTPDELAEIWDMIEKHIELEKKTVALAEEALGVIKGTKMLVPEYFLHYLLEDETKHNHLLEQLEALKRGIYPYA
jgi:hypothetical protein